MRKLIKITIFAMVAMMAFAACRDNDDYITPELDLSPIRGGFPQGNSKYDSIIYDIKQKWGVYLLYKDVTIEDMNRDWVSAGTGDIYVAGDSTERNNESWDLPEEHLPFYVNFFQDYIFPCFKDPEFAKSTFPVKIYMIDSLRTEKRVFSDDNKVEEDESNSEEDESNSEEDGTDTNPYKTIKLGNFDNWAISFPDSIVEGKQSEYTLLQQRCVLMINIIKKSIEDGDITPPAGFWEEYDFSKSSTCDTDKDHSRCSMVEVVDSTADNYIYKIGFVDVLEEKFGTGRSKEIIKNVNISKGKPMHASNWKATNKNNTWDMFQAYIMNAMWYTEAKFDSIYQTDTNDKIKKQYDRVVNHMLNKYGLDLKRIALGKEKVETEPDDNN